MAKTTTENDSPKSVFMEYAFYLKETAKDNAIAIDEINKKVDDLKTEVSKVEKLSEIGDAKLNERLLLLEHRFGELVDGLKSIQSSMPEVSRLDKRLAVLETKIYTGFAVIGFLIVLVNFIFGIINIK